MVKIDIKDGLGDELNTPIKLRWAIRTFVLGLVLGALIWGGKKAADTVVELNERQTVEAYVLDTYSTTRGFENGAYGTYWQHCGVWVSAGHVDRETRGAVPAGVSGDPVSSIDIDAVFYGKSWSCDTPADIVEGQKLWIAGYPGGSDTLAMRQGVAYIKRSSSGSDGYVDPTWVIVFPKNNLATWLSEPVAGGMSGGVVVDAETLAPVGILVTQNSPTFLPSFGEVHSADVVSLHDAHAALLGR